MVSAASSRKKSQPALAASYRFSGVNRKGKAVSGEISATDLIRARALLRQQGITPQSLRRRSRPLLSGSRRISSSEMATMTRQLATMLASGIPLLQSLEIISKGCHNDKLQQLLTTLATDVASGTTLSEALAKHPRHFDRLYCDLVHAGEQSGSLDVMFDRIATYREKSEALKSKISKAMFYPAIVLLAGILVSAVLLLFVVPQFEQIFKGFGAGLPAFTQLVVDMSRWLQANSRTALLSLLISAVAITMYYRRSAALRRRLDYLLLRLPIFGTLFHKAALARFSRTLQTTYASGIPLVDALQSTSGTAGNARYRRAILAVREEVTSGMQMHVAMRMHQLFPPMVIQMVMIGEESGAIDSMLGKVADIYEREVDDMVDGLSSMIEPLIIIILGGLVGSLMIAMYLPIFRMGQVIG